MAENAVRRRYLREVLSIRTSEAHRSWTCWPCRRGLAQLSSKYFTFRSKKATAQGIRLILGDQHMFSMGTILKTHDEQNIHHFSLNHTNMPGVKDHTPSMSFPEHKC